MNRVLSLSPGVRFGNYELAHELGRGLIGEAFAARVLEGPRAGDLLCLKILGRQYHEPDAAHRGMAVKSLLREARVIQQLDHPNIARLLDFGTVGNVWYLALELVQGATLRKLIQRAQLRAFHVMRVGFEVSKALACAHDHNVVHRDIKPSNVLVGQGGEVKLVDFGIAKLITASADFTRHIGTPRYFAPEQLQGEALTPATDVYSLGLVLFEALVGAHPFLVPDEKEFRRNVLEDRRVHSLRDRGFPEDLVAIIEQCIATRPEDRFAHGSALATAFAQVIESHSPATALGAVGERLSEPVGEPLGAPLGEHQAGAVEPLSVQSVHDNEAETRAGSSADRVRAGSLAERVGDIRDELEDFPTQLREDPHRRPTTAVDPRELAANAAGMMGYDESALAQELSQMARLAGEQQGAGTEPVSVSRPIPDATTPGRASARAANRSPQRRTTEAYVRRREPNVTELEMIPDLGLRPAAAAPEPAMPPRDERANTVPPKPRPPTKLVTVVALLVVAVALALIALSLERPREDAKVESRAGSRSAAPSPGAVVSPKKAPVAADGDEGQQPNVQRLPERPQELEGREKQQTGTEPQGGAASPATDTLSAAVKPEPSSKPAKRAEALPRIDVTIGLLPYGEVFVDGRDLGQAPVTVALTPGRHRVLARIGQIQRVQTIVVSAEATSFVIRVHEER